jgi:MATE family multidrug resistance protein
MFALNNSTSGARQVLSLAWPVMLSMLSLTAMNVVGTLFVVQVGTDAVAGTGLAMPASYLAFTLGLGLARAIKIETAQSTGAGRDTGRLAVQALWIALLSGLFAWLFIPFGPLLLGWFGADASVLPYAHSYFWSRLLGAPAVIGLAALTSWFQGRGDTKTPMAAALVGNLVNVALDALFVLGLGLQTMGAGLAASLASLIGFLYLLWQAKSALVLALPDRVFLARAWELGSPEALNFGLNVGGFLVFAGLVSQVGAEALAAHVLVLRIISISFLPGQAVGEAACVLVGQAVGAGDLKAARAAWLASLQVALVLMVGLGLSFVLIPDIWLLVFKPEAEVARVGRQLLMVAALFQVSDAVVIITRGALNGAGETRFLLWVMVGAAWLVQLPVAWLLLGPLGAPGAWLGLLAETLVVGVGLGLRALSVFREEKLALVAATR